MYQVRDKRACEEKIKTEQGDSAKTMHYANCYQQDRILYERLRQNPWHAGRGDVGDVSEAGFYTAPQRFTQELKNAA